MNNNQNNNVTPITQNGHRKTSNERSRSTIDGRGSSRRRGVHSRPLQIRLASNSNAHRAAPVVPTPSLHVPTTSVPITAPSKHDDSISPLGVQQPNTTGNFVPPNPPTSQKIYQNLREFYDDYRVAIPVNCGLEEAFADVGFRTVPSSVSTASHHILSRSFRDLVVPTILRRECSNNVRSLRVLDWCGSTRNLRFVPPRQSSDAGLHVNFVSAPAFTALGDMVRTGCAPGTRQNLVPGDLFDVVIVQDVYQDVGIGNAPFSAKTVQMLSRFSKSGVVYIAVRDFVGEFGADEIKVGRRTFCEGVWYRNEEGMIVFSPERGTTSYAPHPSNEWLQYPYHEGVESMMISRMGPYSIYRCAVTNARPTIKSNTFTETQKIGAYVKVSASSFPEWCEFFNMSSVFNKMECYLPEFLQRRKLLVHIPTYISLSHKYAMKVSNGLTVDSALTAVQSCLEADPRTSEIKLRFPMKFSEILHGTHLAVLYGRKQSVVQELTGFRRDFAVNEKLLLEARAATAEPTTSYSYIAVLGVLLAFFPLLYSKIKTYLSKRAPVARLRLQVMQHGIIANNTAFSEIGRQLESKSNWFWYWQILCFLCTCLVLFIKWYCSLEKQLAQEFLSSHANGERYNPGVTMVINLPRETMIQPKVPNTDFSYVLRDSLRLSCTHNDLPVTLEQLVKNVSENPGIPTNVVYPLVITNGLLHQPARNDLSLLKAVYCRIFRKVPRDESVAYRLVEGKYVLVNDEANYYYDVSKNWQNVRKIFKTLQFPGIEFLPTFLQSVQDMGKRAQRIINAADEDMKGVMLNISKEITLKWNETIYNYDKPRAITNYTPVTHSRMSQWASAIQYNFHEIGDGKIYDFNGTPLRIHFCSGYSANYLAAMIDWEFFGLQVFVNGDDSLCIDHRSVLRIWEMDLSMCDQSLGREVLLEFFPSLFRDWNVEEEFIQDFEDHHSCGFKVTGKTFTITAQTDPQEGTGSKTTTEVNSIVTAGSILLTKDIESANKCQMEARDIVVAMGSLGLVAKIKIWNSLDDPFTFLKGWWLNSREGNKVWVPLPSLVVKLGKIMTPPVIATRIRGMPDNDLRTAQLLMSFAVANSYTWMVDYPILSAFIKMMQRLGKKTDRCFVDIENQHKEFRMVGNRVHLDAEFAFQQIESRYGITPFEIKELESKMALYGSIPCCVVSPVFIKLIEVDYA